MSGGKEISEEWEKVRRYYVGEHRDELRRVLSKIIGRQLTGRVEIDLSQGAPGAMRSRETVKDK